MSEVELVWIRECEVCGKEHSQLETSAIQSMTEIEKISAAFKSRCEQWYRSHVELLMAGQERAITVE